ncbi:MAG: Proposed peptidoglycan lipid II flippase MurJ [uncultured Thiotrichaceae bacterium]|uniref:Probable lipid II flippase MurJ n=1 Tax=uncultured Thiotrichaceae bacterium TaxID=298394 RepID=A0A6S6SMK8_9GAMM|nr:MAG: Proposed peptidoglycan lipid II flippase MurJ [uncultured Thiotrichaceae bacterium]
MNRLLRSSAVISAMTMISRILGLVRDMVLFHLFPVGGATDAFLAANRIPNLLRRLVAEGAFSLAFVPVLSEYKETKSKEALQDLIDYVTGRLMLILFLITIVGVIAAPIVMQIFAPGFSTKEGARPELAADLLRITFPYIFFISLSAMAGGILNTWNKFAVPAFTPVLLNIVMILAMVWWAPYFDEPVTAIAWAVFIGGIAQLAFQIPSLIRLGVLPRPRFKRAHEGVSKILKLMLPALFGSSVAQVNLLLNTIIASMISVGSISWLYSSDRFVELPLALFGVALGVVILPKLSKDHAKSDGDNFKQTLNWAIRVALVISLPATIGLMLLAKPILGTVVYNISAWTDIQMAGMSLITYAIGLPAFVLVKVLAPGFYSRQDTKTPVKVGIVAVFANMLLSLLIVYPWYQSGAVGAHAGLALAVALAGYVNAISLMVILIRQDILHFSKDWVGFLARIFVAIAMMGAVLYFLNPVDEWWRETKIWGRLGTLFGLIILAAISYLGSLMLLGINLKKLIKGTH